MPAGRPARRPRPGAAAAGPLARRPVREYRPPMKRFLKWSLLAAGVLLVALAVGLQFFLGAIVVSGVNRYGPAITHTAVSLAGANLSPFTGAGTLRGLQVGNPPGWSATPALALASVRVRLRPFSVLGDHIVIDEITVDGPEFDYETRFVTSNLGDLTKQLEGNAAAHGAPSAATTRSGQPIRFEVHRLVLQNARVRVAAIGQSVTVPVPDLTLTDLGTREGGITPEQFSAAVMRRVTASLATAVGQSALKLGPAEQSATERIGEGIKAVKGLFSGRKK